jgi:hypothetical protein
MKVFIFYLSKNEGLHILVLGFRIDSLFSVTRALYTESVEIC